MVQRIEVGWRCGGGNISNGQVGWYCPSGGCGGELRGLELGVGVGVGIRLGMQKKIQIPRLARLLARDGPDGEACLVRVPPSGGRGYHLLASLPLN